MTTSTTPGDPEHKRSKRLLLAILLALLIAVAIFLCWFIGLSLIHI